MPCRMLQILQKQLSARIHGDFERLTFADEAQEWLMLFSRLLHTEIRINHAQKQSEQSFLSQIESIWGCSQDLNAMCTYSSTKLKVPRNSEFRPAN